MHCSITVVTMVLYQKIKDKSRTLKMERLANTCKDFFPQHCRNTSRNKMLPFSCTKREIYENPSAVRNVILCLYL